MSQSAPDLLTQHIANLRGVLPEWASKNHLLVAHYPNNAIANIHQDADDTLEPTEETLVLIVAHDKKYYTGLKGILEDTNYWCTTYGSLTIRVYDIRNFMERLAVGDLEAHSLLWLPPKYYVYVGPAIEVLLSHRNDFLSKVLIETLEEGATHLLDEAETYLTDLEFVDRNADLTRAIEQARWLTEAAFQLCYNGVVVVAPHIGAPPLPSNKSEALRVTRARLAELRPRTSALQDVVDVDEIETVFQTITSIIWG